MKFLPIILLFFLVCCENMNEISTIPSDLTPPTLVSLNVLDETTITIESNESIQFKGESYYSREGLSIEEVSCNSNIITLTLDRKLIPGMQYCSEFRIEDENGNSLSFISKYYGYNPNSPNIIINEFIVKGTNTNPDKIELYVVNGGNMAGLSLFNGSKENYDYVYIFPEIEVKTGEFIVVRSISEKYNLPCIEVNDLSINNDKKFIEGVRDLRIEDFKLSSTNGVIALYSNPYGDVIDSVIYTKNSNDEAKDYRNFGLSKTVNRVDDITEDGGWIGIYDLIFPDDSIYIGNSTTTRSLNRLDFIDTDKKSDWYTVATSEATFGFKNSQVYY